MVSCTLSLRNVSTINSILQKLCSRQMTTRRNGTGMRSECCQLCEVEVLLCVGMGHNTYGRIMVYAQQAKIAESIMG